MASGGIKKVSVVLLITPFPNLLVLPSFCTRTWQATGVMGYAVVPNAREVKTLSIMQTSQREYKRTDTRGGLYSTTRDTYNALTLPTGTLQYLCEDTGSAAATAKGGCLQKTGRAGGATETTDCAVGKPTPMSAWQTHCPD